MLAIFKTLLRVRLWWSKHWCCLSESSIWVELSLRIVPISFLAPYLVIFKKPRWQILRLVSLHLRVSPVRGLWVMWRSVLGWVLRVVRHVVGLRMHRGHVSLVRIIIAVIYPVRKSASVPKFAISEFCEVFAHNSLIVRFRGTCCLLRFIEFINVDRQWLI